MGEPEDNNVPLQRTQEELDKHFESLWLEDMPKLSRAAKIVEKVIIEEEPSQETIINRTIVKKAAKTTVNENITEEGQEDTTNRDIHKRRRPKIRRRHREVSERKPYVKKEKIVEPEPENLIPVQERFADLKAMVKLVVDKVRPSYFISGKSGAAKSYSVLYMMDQLGLKEGVDYFLAKGTASPVGIYSTLHKWNGKTVIFDDADQAFKDKTSTNLLKSALDSVPVRRICWITQTNFDPDTLTSTEIEELVKKGKLPKFFDCTCGVIFVSNIPFKEVDSAIKTRSMVQDLQLTQEELFEEMQRNLTTIHPTVSMDFKQKILDTLRTGYANKNKEVSFRTLVTAIALAANGTENWERLVLRYA